MKKKILIQMHSMQIGGAETSLINFVRNLKNDFEMDVVLFSKAGALLEPLEKEVNVFDVCEEVRQIRASADASLITPEIEPFSAKLYRITEKIVKSIPPLDWLAKVRRKRLNVKKKERLIKQVQDWPGIDKGYDIAITFFLNSYLDPLYTIEKIAAKKKFAICHMDLKLHPGLNNHSDILYKFDKILCVSDSIRKQIEELYPKIKGKTGVLRNFQDMEGILKKSEEYEVELPDKFNIVSAVRLEQQKAIPRSVKVMAKIVKERKDFCWTILGEGRDRNEIDRLIKKYKLEDQVKLAGAKTNPFPYIKKADLFFLGSVYEAAPMVYAEAMMLGVPVLSTRNVSTDELLNEAGFVCDNSEKGIYLGLKDLLENPEKVAKMKEKIANYKYDNEGIRRKFIELCEN